MEVIVSLVQNQSWFGIATAVVALASAIAACTPTPKSGTTMSKLYAVIDLLALNIGKAKQTGK
jgi:hypothetical protein